MPQRDLPEVIQPFRGQSIIIPLPRELSLQIATGGKGLACFDDLKDQISLHGRLKRRRE